MASSSAPRAAGGSSRMTSVVDALCGDYQSFIVEIRRTLGVFKGIAVDLERDKNFSEVKELEEAVLELLKASEGCAHLSSAVKAVGEAYVPSKESTDFGNLLTEESNRLNAASPFDPQRNPFYRQFKEAVWNVHHAGQLMPGDETEDIVMTGTQNSLLNITCPLTGKPVTELEDPVRSMDCKHIYEKAPVLQYIKIKAANAYCPVAGCPRVLKAGRVTCDPLLVVEIDEMRSRRGNSGCSSFADDFTELDDD
ncbi:RING/U-box superfamily protein [Wolffia australiana]